MKRLNFSKQLVVSTALSSVCGFAVWSYFGSHLRRASSDIIGETFYCAPRYAALRECQLTDGEPTEQMVRCVFGGLSFDLPSSMAGTAKVVRLPPSSVWLVFEDSGRFVQFQLSGPDPDSMISISPPVLVKKSVPRLLATVAAVSSEEFSFGLRPSELRIYEWAIANRRSIDFEAQRMDRFAVRSSETMDVFLVTTDPNANFSKKQIRAWLVWEVNESGGSGSMYFGYSTEQVDWIHALATTIEVNPENRSDSLRGADFSTMKDDELLDQLQFEPIE